MTAFTIRFLELLATTVFSISTLQVFAAGSNEVTPLEACMEFASGGAHVFWTLKECMDVWSAWADSVPIGLHRDYPDRRLMKDVAVEMRQRGQPCVVQPLVMPDGVGSAVTRHLAAWLYAAEIGCDFVTPDFGYDAESDYGPEGGTLYCHPSAGEKELEAASKGALLAGQTLESCELVDWLRFFQLDVPSVPEPQATFRNVTGSPRDQEDLIAALEEIRVLGWDGLPDDFRLRFNFHPSIGSRYTLALGSWDQYKRTIARDVLATMRSNFHEFPRLWYNERPECDYDSSQLNFAIHVRMGDRKSVQGDLGSRYFDRLHDFVGVVTTAVLARGLSAPMFHVFTETKFPCPSGETGAFPEFPVWPVEIDQIPPCVSAVSPDDCPEKRAGADNCNADRTGIFHVVGRPLVLHVGGNARECLSCMIQADGVLMGCSTFGQIAGLLTKGIKFFSVGCVGLRTPVQYRMIPPLAVSEYGHMWVPIEGSWRDPALTASAVFDVALTALTRLKKLPFQKPLRDDQPLRDDYASSQAGSAIITDALNGGAG